MAKYFLLLAVLVGVAGRNVSHASHDHADCHAASHGCGHHDHEDPDDYPLEPVEHEKSAPSAPSPDFHHHSCCLPLPFSVYEENAAALKMPAVSLAEMLPLHLLPPDDPVFALDKPPLI